MFFSSEEVHELNAHLKSPRLLKAKTNHMVCGRSGEDWTCGGAEDLASDGLGPAEG